MGEARLPDQPLQNLNAGGKVDCSVDPDHRAPDQPGFPEHEVDQAVVIQFRSLESERLETRTAEIEHLGGRSPSQKFYDLLFAEGIFEKITVIEGHFFERKKLLRFTAGSSPDPAIKINLLHILTSGITQFLTQFPDKTHFPLHEFIPAQGVGFQIKLDLVQVPGNGRKQCIRDGDQGESGFEDLSGY